MHQPGASSSSCWPPRACVATQATVSRDLEDLGAIKVRVAGRRDRLRHPRAARASSGRPRTTSAGCFGDWVVEVAHSGNLVVLRTPPGSAHVVGSALDRSGLPGVLGTVAGDDTLIVVVAEDAGGAAMADAGLAEPGRPLTATDHPTRREGSDRWRSEWSSPTAAASTPPWPSAG